MKNFADGSIHNFNTSFLIMKFFSCHIFLLFPVMLFAQTAKFNYAAIDRKVFFIKEEKIDSLSKQLNDLGKTDREKTRAIFRWITEHINYNVRIFNRNKINPGNFFEEPEDTIEILPSLNERVAAKVLKRKIAFCDGYSRLFKALCDRSGIRSEIILGFARTNQSNQGRFGVNHSWNAVYLDSSWYLLDVTWASGFVSYANEYVKQYNDFYFLTAPEDFFRDHYPEDIQWALLDNPPFYREFNQKPFRHSGFNKYGITSYFPEKGIIEAAAGDIIRFDLKTKKEIKNFFVAESFQPDSLLFYNQTIFNINTEKASLNYTVTGSESEWLYVFFNDELVLRYKLNKKKSEVRKE